MSKNKFARLTEEGEKRKGGSRHERRGAAAEVRREEGLSVPAMKKIIRRNRQRLLQK